jgi:hypothetical protein
VFVALVIQHAMRMRHMSSVACPALQYLSTLSDKRRGIWENVVQPKMCVLIFCTTVQLLSETFVILRRTDRDMITTVCWLSCKVAVVVVVVGRF